MIYGSAACPRLDTDCKLDISCENVRVVILRIRSAKDVHGQQVEHVLGPSTPCTLERWSERSGKQHYQAARRDVLLVLYRKGNQLQIQTDVRDSSE